MKQVREAADILAPRLRPFLVRRADQPQSVLVSAASPMKALESVDAWTGTNIDRIDFDDCTQSNDFEVIALPANRVLPSTLVVLAPPACYRVLPNSTRTRPRLFDDTEEHRELARDAS